MEKHQITTIATQLKAGKVGIIPTDTIYGLVASAKHPAAVERIYQLKQRDTTKPCIILVAHPDNVSQFGVDRLKLSQASAYWPGAVSVVVPIPAPNKQVSYLLRGGESLAFRCPKTKWLRQLLEESGPLIAPSANPEGLPPAATITEAQKYFSERVDFYHDAGELVARPSKLISLLTDKPLVLR